MPSFQEASRCTGSRNRIVRARRHWNSLAVRIWRLCAFDFWWRALLWRCGSSVRRPAARNDAQFWPDTAAEHAKRRMRSARDPRRPQVFAMCICRISVCVCVSCEQAHECRDECCAQNALRLLLQIGFCHNILVLVYTLVFELPELPVVPDKSAQVHSTCVRVFRLPRAQRRSKSQVVRICRLCVLDFWWYACFCRCLPRGLARTLMP
jgi:hypothetical protein